MSDVKIDLNGMTMNAVETDENGVIGVDTIFKFRQTGGTCLLNMLGERFGKGIWWASIQAPRSRLDIVN